MEREEDRVISVFNDAIPQIRRLDKDWTECKRLREQGKLIDLYWKLDSLYSELAYDAGLLDKEKKQTDNGYLVKLNNITIMIRKALVNKDRYALYQALLAKEILLKEIQEEAGKGSKRRPAEEDVMEA